MRFLSANYLFPIHQQPIRDGVLVVDNEGKIIDVLDPLQQEIPDNLSVEKYEGILCPGFVNAHCHLELSHLKGKLTPQKKLTHFISEIIEKRNASDEIIIEAMKEADSEMYKEGIVAVGDISNSPVSKEIKNKSKIYYHTFIELFDISEDRSEEVLRKGIDLKREFTSSGLKASLVPHALYSVTKKLLKLILEESENDTDILCMHNQETSSENEMFEMGAGALFEKLLAINIAYENWKPSGKSSLLTVLDVINSKQFFQMVHNTYTGLDDILAAKKFINLFWCFCIRANLFIENAIPDIGLFLKEKCYCTIGTDSLASNDSLSILQELMVIQNRFSGISLNELLTMATLNGAIFLRVNDRFGSFEKGKIPGINWIGSINPFSLAFTEKSRVSRII
jgi:cytosine/adenosine deaminase-related metal-dependent hydrolase